MAILAGIATPVYAPWRASAVSVGNAGSTDLSIYTTDDTNAVTIAAGWERAMTLAHGQMFRVDVAAFYVKCSQDSTVVLVWS